MKNGRLATNITVALTNIGVYTVSADAKVGIINIRCVNPNSSDGLLRIAVTAGDVVPTAQDLIENGAIDNNGGVIERTGLTLSPGEKIWVYSDISGISIRVDGFER